uniref:Uncharacterized protein n=1 Tax=Rhizophora mucronata TaxID=61149 RepID=A0A2P2NG46_RHIMU
MFRNEGKFKIRMGVLHVTELELFGGTLTFHKFIGQVFHNAYPLTLFVLFKLILSLRKTKNLTLWNNE